MAALHGHALIRANICGDCEGELLARDGSHSEIYYDDGRVAYALPICNYCKQVRIFTERTKVPLDFKTRYEQLRALRTPGGPRVNYAVCMWEKAERTHDEITTQRVVVNMDGSVLKRDDFWDGNASFSSHETEGWKPLKLKNEYVNLRSLLEYLDEYLPTRGYRRLF